MSETNKDALSASQVQALAAAMLSVARIDGLHPAEEALIVAFYRENTGGAEPDLAKLEALLKDPHTLPEQAIDAEFAETLVRMCVMTGYADGHLSDAEWAHVQAMGAQVGLGGGRVQEIRTEVKDLLVASLSHLPVAESVAEVAKSL
jgi:tellurite resistance protein